MICTCISNILYLPSYEGLTKGLFNPCNGLNLTVYNHKVNKSPCLLDSSFIKWSVIVITHIVDILHVLSPLRTNQTPAMTSPWTHPRVCWLWTTSATSPTSTRRAVSRSVTLLSWRQTLVVMEINPDLWKNLHVQHMLKFKNDLFHRLFNFYNLFQSKHNYKSYDSCV